MSNQDKTMFDVARDKLRALGVDESEIPRDGYAAIEMAYVLERRRSEAASRETERPVVHAGEVAANLFNDLGLVFRRIQMADAFEAKVLAAAKSPAAWMMLREELNAGPQPPSEDRTGEGVKP